MTAINGVDYAGHVSGEALAAAGVKFAARYFNPGYDKTIGEAEAVDLHTNGIAIVGLCETSAGFILTGHKATQAVAKECDDYASSIGVPLRALYLACDQNITSASYADVDDGLFGASLALGRERVGIYGEADLIRHCQDAGTAAWFMQSYAWSGTNILPGIHLYQTKRQTTIAGTTVDIDTAYATDYGQWPRPADGSGDESTHVLKDDNDMMIVHCINPKTNTRDYGLLCDAGIRHLQSMDTVNALAAHMPKVEINRTDWNGLLVS